MQVKIFRAANLQSALEEIREQLGPHASVLRTRQCRDGWMGWLGRSYVEVTAGLNGPGDQDHQGIPPDGTKVDDSSGLRHTASPHSAQNIAGLTRGLPGKPVDARLTNQDTAIGKLHERSQTAVIHSGSFTAQHSDPLERFRSELVSLGVDPIVVDRWIRSAGGFTSNLADSMEFSWLDSLHQSIARELSFAGPIRIHPGERRVVALVGPTGVGKTTTVAKLAAGFRLKSKRRVGLLTIDTFRIAAVQQLQAYAQIMDLPMRVVESADQMHHAMNQLGDVDLILIDTAGRSPKEDVQVEALVELLRQAQPDETHLVISATSSAAVVKSAIDGFSVSHPTAAILTKLDEAPYTAGVLSAILPSQAFAGLPISYVTTGQHVPDDIEIATAERALQRLLPNPLTIAPIEAA